MRAHLWFAKTLTATISYPGRWAACKFHIIVILKYFNSENKCVSINVFFFFLLVFFLSTAFVYIKST